MYSTIAKFAKDNTEPTWRHANWGTGFRSRREVVKKTLGALGLSTDWVHHGIEREIFAIPLADNARQFLRGEHQRLRWHKQSSDELFEWFKNRWLLPRAARDERYRQFERSSYQLWQ
jgi:hypothetical protein